MGWAAIFGSLAAPPLLLYAGAILWTIVGGWSVDPPAALIEAINRSNARLLRLFGRPVTA